MRNRGHPALLAVVAACGGIAVIDPSSGGGGEGAGATGANGEGGAVVVVGSSAIVNGTGGGVGGSLCKQACDRYQGCLTDRGNNCNGGCNSVNGNCASLHESWLECLLVQPDPGTCAQSASCIGLLQSYLDCEAFLNPNAGTVCFLDDQGACAGCKVEGLEGESYESSCDGGSCSCTIDGKNLGKCVEGSTSLCDLVNGCCGLVLWLDGIGT